MIARRTFLALTGLALAAPYTSVAAPRVELLTSRSVSTFREPTIGAAAAIEIGRLAATQGWRGSLSGYERDRVHHLVGDAVATARTLGTDALTAHAAHADRKQRITASRRQLDAVRAMIEDGDPAWRTVAAELGKASLLMHGAATLVDPRAVIKIKIATVHGLIGDQGVVSVIGEKGVAGATSVLGPGGVVAADAVLSKRGLVAEIGKALRSERAMSLELSKLEKARLAAEAQLGAPSRLDAPVRELATANASLTKKLR